MAAVPESWGKLKSSGTTISLRVCTNRRVSFSSPHRQYRLPRAEWGCVHHRCTQDGWCRPR
jgi:hypothetical protein